MQNIHPLLLIITLILPLSTCDDLLYVLEVVRHGARSQVHSTPYYPDLNWPDGDGQLTDSGMREHLLLGKFIREKYITDTELISPQFTPSEIYIRSTDVNRTIMSIYSQLMGIFPEKISPLPVHDLGAKPPLNLSISEDVISELGGNVLPYSLGVYPIHVFEKIYDKTILFDSCPYYNYIKDQNVFNNTIYTDIKKKYGNLLQKICNSLGVDCEEVLIGRQTLYMTDALICADYNGQRPNSIPETLMPEIKELFYELFKGELLGEWDTKYPVLINVPMTGLTHFIKTKFNARINDENPERMSILSSHDSVVLPMATGLGHLPENILPFASNIFFELWKGNTQNYVKVYYNGEVFIDNMGVQEFYEFLESRIIPGEWDSEYIEYCKLSSHNITKEDLAALEALRLHEKLLSSKDNMYSYDGILIEEAASASKKEKEKERKSQLIKIIVCISVVAVLTVAELVWAAKVVKKANQPPVERGVNIGDGMGQDTGIDLSGTSSINQRLL